MCLPSNKKNLEKKEHLFLFFLFQFFYLILMTMLVFKVGNIETGDLYTIRIDISDFRFLFSVFFLLPFLLLFFSLHFFLFFFLLICHFLFYFLSFFFLFSFLSNSMVTFKNCLSTFSGVQPNEQILLIGPPYKKLDNQVTLNSSLFSFLYIDLIEITLALSLSRSCSV